MGVEVIKTTANMEFDVIYADGTRRHVAEGILYEVEGNEIIFHKGTGRSEVSIACAEDILKYLNLIGPGLLALSIGMTLNEDAKEALCKLVMYSLEVLPHSTAHEQAVFRLGQMDFQQSAADMLEDVSRQTEDGLVASAYLQAAALVRGMEIPGGE